MTPNKVVIIGTVLLVAGLMLRSLRHEQMRTAASNAELRVALEQAEQKAKSVRKVIEQAEPKPGEPVAATNRFSQARLAGSRADSTGSRQSIPHETPRSSRVGFVTLNKSNLNRLELKPFNDEFRLTDEVVAVLGMSEDEKAKLNQALGGLIEQHAQLDSSMARQINEHLTDEPGLKTTFKVDAYPEKGKTLAREFLESSRVAIGSNRTDLLVGYADLNSLSADGFEPFGATEKTITFLDRTDGRGQRGDCRIFMKVTDSRTGFTLSTSFANDDDHIPASWRHLLQNIHPEK